MPAQTMRPVTNSGPKVVELDRAKQIDALLLDIFELTGHKVTKDDPILVAALIQSSLVRRAGDDAANSIQDAVVNAVAELAEAVKIEREQAANLDRTVANAFQQITDASKVAGDQELTSMQTRFSRMASETLENVRKEASKQAPGITIWKLSALLLGGIAIGLVVGVIIGKSRTPKITADQLRLMHNGMLLDSSWSKLPKVARDLVEASGTSVVIENNLEKKSGKDR